MSIQIVPMNADHLEELEKLERLCFSRPWSRKMLAEELENQCAAFLVAQDSATGQVVGYAGLLVMADEGYITNVAVFPAYRRRGVAAKLISVFENFARGNKLAFLTLEVRPSTRRTRRWRTAVWAFMTAAAQGWRTTIRRPSASITRPFTGRRRLLTMRY